MKSSNQFGADLQRLRREMMVVAYIKFLCVQFSSTDIYCIVIINKIIFLVLFWEGKDKWEAVSAFNRHVALKSKKIMQIFVTCSQL